MLQEFREFALRGNVVDLAVGVIIGAAFNKIVDSLVEDIVMPPIGLLLGGVDFSNLYLSLSGERYASFAAAQEAGAATINYGQFINTVIEFLIVAFVVFLLVRQINRMHREPEKVPTMRECPFCHTQISKKATRCPNCTSELTPVEPESAASTA